MSKKVQVPDLVVKSKVKEAIKAKNMNTASDLFDGLNAEVDTIIKKAVKRCADNGRKTVSARDL